MEIILHSKYTAVESSPPPMKPCLVPQTLETTAVNIIMGQDVFSMFLNTLTPLQLWRLMVNELPYCPLGVSVFSARINSPLLQVY